MRRFLQLQKFLHRKLISVKGKTFLSGSGRWVSVSTLSTGKRLTAGQLCTYYHLMPCGIVQIVSNCTYVLSNTGSIPIINISILQLCLGLTTKR